MWHSPSVSSSIPSPNFDTVIPLQKDPVETVNDNPVVELYDLDEETTDSLHDMYSDEVFVDVASTEVVWEEDSSPGDIVIPIIVLVAVLSGYEICGVI